MKAFLESTSRWADYIIIADQMSTDGSREIARSYQKVILIDNLNPEFNEAERQRMLVNKAREVAAGRDTLLWGLDADEILASNFRETEDWKRILSSKPGDVFWFKWAEIRPDKNTYWLSPHTCYPWLFHDDGHEPHGNYVRNMHSMRIPYPIEEKQMYHVNDFRVLHLAYLNACRVRSKRRFYQFVDWEMNHRSPVSLYRSYTQAKDADQVLPLPVFWLGVNGRNILDLVDCDSTLCWMDDYVRERLGNHPLSEIRRLPIWDAEFRGASADPRRVIDKLVHGYLSVSSRWKKTFPVRALDKILKKIYA